MRYFQKGSPLKTKGVLKKGAQGNCLACLTQYPPQPAAWIINKCAVPQCRALKGSFPLRAWNGVFFACFMDIFASLNACLDFKRGKINKRNKEYSILGSQWQRDLRPVSTTSMEKSILSFFY